jgi:putative sterol carrier protein
MSEALAKTFSAMKDRYKTGVIDSPVTFYFSLGDGPGQKWLVKLTPDACEAEEGKGDADCFLKTSEELFLKLIQGEWVPGIMDFMSGKIKSNDPTKLTLLKDCFST